MIDLGEIFKTQKENNRFIYKNKARIVEANRGVIRDVITLAFFLIIVNLILSIYHKDNVSAVFCGTSILILMFLYQAVLKLKKYVYVFICYYATLAVVFAFGIYKSVYVQPEHVSIAFSIMLMVLPMLIVDYALRVSLFLTGVTGIGLIFVNIYKVGELCITDNYTILMSYVLGIMVGILMGRVRLTNIILVKEAVFRENIDFLTGIPNRKVFFDEFNNKGHIRGIIMVDVDFFKKYNDRYGHLEGDTCLKKIAGALKSTNTDNSEFFRYGGEEFIGIYYGKTEKELLSLCQSIREKVEELGIVHEDNKKGIVSISVGYNFFEEKPAGLVSIQCADIAVYQAKKNGRDQIVRYDQSLQNAEDNAHEFA